MKKGKNKSYDQALNQLRRIVNYYNKTGRSDTAQRVSQGTKTNGVIKNMNNYRYINYGDTETGWYAPISLRNRTTAWGEDEYWDALKNAQMEEEYTGSRSRREASGKAQKATTTPSKPKNNTIAKSANKERKKKNNVSTAAKAGSIG